MEKVIYLKYIEHVFLDVRTDVAIFEESRFLELLFYVDLFIQKDIKYFLFLCSTCFSASA